MSYNYDLMNSSLRNRKEYRENIETLIALDNVSSSLLTDDDKGCLLAMEHLKERTILNKALKIYNQEIDECKVKAKRNYRLGSSGFIGLSILNVISIISGNIWLLLAALGLSIPLAVYTSIKPEYFTRVIYTPFVYEIALKMGYSSTSKGIQKLDELDSTCFQIIAKMKPEIIDETTKEFSNSIQGFKNKLREKEFREVLISSIGREKAEEYFKLFV